MRVGEILVSYDKLDEIVKAARFLQIEGAKDFEISASGIMTNRNSSSTVNQEASITAYCADECPPTDLMRPFAWLGARAPGSHPGYGHDSSLDSMPNSPSSLHSSDSFDSTSNLTPMSGKPTIIVNGATGEFTTLYQQMSPINLKLNAPSADNKQELKRKLLQKRQMISNGGLIDYSSLPKKSCLEMRLAAPTAHQVNMNGATNSTLSNDLQVTITQNSQSTMDQPLMLVNGNKHKSVIKSTIGLVKNEHDEPSKPNLRISVDDTPKNGENMTKSLVDVDGDNNNNLKSHEVKDNVVIVNQNSSKCLTLKIKSGKIYNSEPSQGKKV